MTRTILTSPEFLSPDVYAAKVKTPFEFVVSALRAAGTEVGDARPIVRELRELGMPLYMCQPPTGYADTADAWVNTGALVTRLNYALKLAGPDKQTGAAARRARISETLEAGAMRLVDASFSGTARSPSSASASRRRSSRGRRSRPAPPAGRSSSSRSSSAAPSMASASSSPSASPTTSARGRRSRSRVPAAAADAAIDLDGFFGLHPRLQPLKPLWDARQLAVVHACGSPDSTRSHFDAQDYMESGTPGVKSTRDGWLNRCLQAKRAPPGEPATPFRAVALSSQLPRMLQGAAPALAMSQIERFGLRGGQAGADGRRIVRGGVRGRAPIGSCTAPAAMRSARSKMLKAADPSKYQPANGADYPRGPFGQALRQIAQLAKANVGLEIAFAESAAGTRTRTRAPRRVSSPRASTTSRARSPRSPPTSAIGWKTRSC